MTKNDHKKTRWDLVPWDALNEVVEVLTFGAEKYGEDNWRTLPDYRRRYFSAAMRHMISWWWTTPTDPESGKSHLAHAICNLLFLLHRSTPPDRSYKPAPSQDPADE